jgi:hypothetical protein
LFSSSELFLGCHPAVGGKVVMKVAMWGKKRKKKGKGKKKATVQIIANSESVKSVSDGSLYILMYLEDTLLDE